MVKTLETRLNDLTAAQLTVLYNAVSDRKVARFSDRPTAVKRVAACLEAAGRDVRIHSMGDPFTYDIIDARPAPARGERDGDDRTITVLADENPKTKGTKSHRRFAIYENGLTVGAYVRLASEHGGGRRKAIRDITWDVSHGFIRLT